MNYRLIISLFLSFFLLSCEQLNNNKTKNLDIKIENKYKNSGFALIYSSDLSKINALEPRSLNIYHKFLKKK